MRVAPYILAGGRSSRMGRDKGMLLLGGKTLLARSVETLRVALRSADLAMAQSQPVPVTVIGDRTLLEGADRVIADRYSGLGPMGGIEAALNDLQANRAADLALFIPVDMPFLPSGLIAALLREWEIAVNEGACVCHVMVDDTPQPLVSLIHRELHPFVLRAIEDRQLRVTPVLQSACKAFVLARAGAIHSSRSVMWLTNFTSDQIYPANLVWHPTEIERRWRPLWFANLNTPENLREAETFPWDEGSIDSEGKCDSDTLT